MSNVIEKAIYKQRKDYLKQYYQDHKEELAEYYRNRYKKQKAAKQKAKEEQWENLTGMICDKYCRHVYERDEEALRLICDNCTLMETLESWKNTK